MNIENLEVGKEYKSKTELCKTLGVKKAQGGRNIKLQDKEFARYFECEKTTGHKVKVVKIYDTPKPKTDGRENNGGNRTKYFLNYLPQEKSNKSIGVYKIILNNKIYIGSTNVGFRRRFLQHTNENNLIKTTYNMLKNGGTFNILEICNGLSEKEIRDKEQYYIDQYKNNKSWIVVNERDTWSMVNNKPKIKFSKIKVNKVNYKKVIQILKENNIDVY